MTNLSASAGRNGALAPGRSIAVLKAGGGFERANGSSVAVLFATGAAASASAADCCFPRLVEASAETTGGTGHDDARVHR
jgi:hypothetical protein